MIMFPMALAKIAAHWLRSCNREARRLRAYTQILHRTTSSRSLQVLSLCPGVARYASSAGREPRSIACDIRGALLRTHNFFPFFMLLAFEGGGLLRALLLLLSYPLVLLLGHQHELSLRTMAFIALCGLRETDVEMVARAVLPKFFLESLDAQAYGVWAATEGKRVVITGVPRVMVEWFLTEYLGAQEVAGAEMHVFSVGGVRFFTGVMNSRFGAAARQKVIRDFFGESKPDIGLVSYGNPHDHIFVSNCKQAYLVNKDGSSRTTLPRENYPKPLIFHDGRLAFLPTPAAAIILFLWLPLGIALFIIRIAIGIFLPYKQLCKIISACTGFVIRIDDIHLAGTNKKEETGGVLYVCNHRTLIDPLMLSAAVGRQLTAVTYSLSPISELISPMPTARLTRDRKLDAEKISKLLKEGDLVVCPEGTTCREPYLLRFSALFAELADKMVPVAVDTSSGMFYGTTASGFKFLDPVFLLMNPRPEYTLRFLGNVPSERTCAAGCSAKEVANGIQKQLAEALSFECTALTRKDKYLMLAGNEGVVEKRRS